MYSSNEVNKDSSAEFIYGGSTLIFKKVYRDKYLTIFAELPPNATKHESPAFVMGMLNQLRASFFKDTLSYIDKHPLPFGDYKTLTVSVHNSVYDRLLNKSNDTQISLDTICSFYLTYAMSQNP